MTAPLGWFGIVRLGLVQAAIGAIVVLMTSTFNRIMVVELRLPALVPGALVALHYAVQVLRPRWGHGSDGDGRRTPWIIGGMAMLAAGGVAAAASTALAATAPLLGVAAATGAFLLIGAGVGAAGTSLLVLAATAVAPARRAAAAPVLWMMMVAGFAITAGLAGSALDPFSPLRLVHVTATVCATAFLVSVAALWGLERGGAQPPAHRRTTPVPFAAAVKQVWSEAPVRRFTLFVFVSMLAYGAQDILIEPFAGTVFHLTPGETTHLSGLQHAGALAGMAVLALAGGLLGRRNPGLLRTGAVAGCLLSAAALGGLALAGLTGPVWPLRPTVLLLGFGDGAFAVAAVGAMMATAGQGAGQREGVRMGLWGAAQAVAFGCGSLFGTAMLDVVRLAFDSPVAAYGGAFLAEAALFAASAGLVRASRPVAQAPLARAVTA